MIDNAKLSWAWRVVFVTSLVAGFSVAARAANTITGVVRNQTQGRFEGGDEVILFRLGQASLGQTSLNKNMQAESRTRTDAQGSFSLDVRYPDKQHLVRVVYQGVNYDQAVSAGAVVSIDVFDAVSKLQGIAGSIEIIRIGIVGDHLHVSDMVEIRNASSPPLTQSGERTFEAYLPAHAKIDSVLAAGPAGIATLISATVTPGEPGRYAVNFPLQPGATKFAFNYDLPYDGHAAFRPRNMYPLQQLAVMFPPSMNFASPSAAFQVLRTGNDRYQVEAATVVKAGEGPDFEISGVGALPAVRGQGEPPQKPAAANPTVPALSGPTSPRVQTADNSTAVVASGVSAQSPPASSPMPWWVLGVSAVVLGGCGSLLWRRRRSSGNAKTKIAQRAEHRGERAVSLAEVLKEELLQLEVDRSLGTISGKDYAAAKQALEETVKRASARVESAEVTQAFLEGH